MNRWELIDELAAEARRIHIDLQCGFPVDVVGICEYLGIEYFEEYMPTKYDGLYFVVPDGVPQIGVNKSPSKCMGRRRFSCAHEIGHHLICRLSPTETRFHLDIQSDKKRPVERVCNIFAAVLLMPQEDVVDFWAANRHRRNGLILLARHFGVTVQAARYRLDELGLLSTPILSRPMRQGIVMA